MPLNNYDREHVGAILDGHGTWYTAELLRALDKLMHKADLTNLGRLRAGFHEETQLLMAYHGVGDDPDFARDEAIDLAKDEHTLTYVEREEAEQL